MRSEDAARKLRNLSSRSRRARSVEPASTLPPALATALAVTHAAYELCARTTPDRNVAVAVTNAAASLANIDPRLRTGARARLSERLRLEWLVALGDSDARLLGECARILAEAAAVPDASDRVRLASAEAYSLHRASLPRAADLATVPEAGWSLPAVSVAFLPLLP